jgi:alkylation response protein AidB-like acyl-CoA dehydrogenase
MTDELTAYEQRAHEWLAQHCEPRSAAKNNDVTVFHDLSTEEESAVITAAAQWQRRKVEAGYGAITWTDRFGGAGLSSEYERAFLLAEGAYATPADHEVRRITVNLTAPTLSAHGTHEQQETYIRRFLRCDSIVCQLFSEPDAGSDLASLRTRASLDGDEWRIDGSKVWVSGAQFADYGFLLARTDPTAPTHTGITAFLLPLEAQGVTVRPIRQITGGRSFNEVFMDDVRLADANRIGEVGAGWKVAKTMLGFERRQSGSRAGVGASWAQLKDLAQTQDRVRDPAVRDALIRTYMHEALRSVTRLRSAAGSAKGTRGPSGSLGKLLWVQGLQNIGDAASQLLGISLIAEAGSEEDFGWNQHVLGAVGFRIAGGTDEIQRNIIAEGVLGLPRDVRAPDRPAKVKTLTHDEAG